MLETLDFENYLFKDREDAANRLLEILPKETAKSEDWVLLCVSSGSVPIVEIIANELELGYDLLFVEPIFAPNNDECQVAMVSEKEEIVIHYNLIESFGMLYFIGSFGLLELIGSFGVLELKGSFRVFKLIEGFRVLEANM